MATHGKDTTAAWNSQSLGSVSSIGDVSITTDTVDISTYNQSDGFKEYLLGLSDAGEIPITCHYDESDTGQQNFVTDFYAKTARTLTITFPTSTGTVWSIPCLPSGFSTAQPLDNKLGITITVKPTGKPSLTTATSAGLTTPFFALSGSGDLSPAAANDVYTHMYTLPNGTSSLTVTPTARRLALSRSTGTLWGQAKRLRLYRWQQRKLQRSQLWSRKPTKRLLRIRSTQHRIHRLNVMGRGNSPP